MATKTFSSRTPDLLTAVRIVMGRACEYLNRHAHPAAPIDLNFSFQMDELDRVTTATIEIGEQYPWAPAHFGSWEAIVVDAVDHDAAHDRAMRYIAGVGFPVDRLFAEKLVEGTRPIWVGLLFRFNLLGIRVGPDSVLAGLTHMPSDARRRLDWSVQRNLRPLIATFDLVLNQEHGNPDSVPDLTAATTYPTGAVVAARSAVMKWAADNNVPRANPALLED